MIKVKAGENGIDMHGHATGSTDVCAAVSAITQMLIQGLTDVTEDKIDYHVDSGNVTIDWQKLSDKGKSLYSAWFLAMHGIQGDTEEYIKFI